MLMNNSITRVNVANKSTGVLPVSFLLKFGALLDTSADTRQLSTVSLLLPANLAHLMNLNTSFNLEWHSQHTTLMQKGEIPEVKRRNGATQTWPFLRILARLNFSLFLTLGFRSIFFLFGVRPLFLAICGNDSHRYIYSFGKLKAKNPRENKSSICRYSYTRWCVHLSCQYKEFNILK